MACLLLANSNLFSCKEEDKEKFEYSKWEHLNIQIISSLAEDICLKQADKIPDMYNYIDLSTGTKPPTEEAFNSFVSGYKNPDGDFRKSLYGRITKVIDSIFIEKNIDFFKQQYLVKKNYISLIKETDCIKNVHYKFPNEEVELSSRKKYFFGKVLFTKNYEYAFLTFREPTASGFMFLKKNNDVYEQYKKYYTMTNHSTF